MVQLSTKKLDFMMKKVKIWANFGLGMIGEFFEGESPPRVKTSVVAFEKSPKARRMTFAGPKFPSDVKGTPP